jgi:hypothetical protein
VIHEQAAHACVGSETPAENQSSRPAKNAPARIRNTRRLSWVPVGSHPLSPFYRRTFVGLLREVYRLADRSVRPVRLILLNLPRRWVIVAVSGAGHRESRGGASRSYVSGAADEDRSWADHRATTMVHGPLARLTTKDFAKAGKSPRGMRRGPDACLGRPTARHLLPCRSRAGARGLS